MLFERCFSILANIVKREKDSGIARRLDLLKETVSRKFTKKKYYRRRTKVSAQIGAFTATRGQG
jgi:hypothetical protein